jgi:oligoribonuclease NrnB/cAMP/cGMP phosphodiesterase (DHH superfamily)
MSKTKFLAASAALCVVFSLNAEAKLYKWVDEGGVTHYGETIPPEYANRDTKMLKNGRVTDRSESFDDDKQKSAKKETAEEKAALEARRRDEALLNSFTTEKEIDLSRDRSLLQIEARINSFNTMIKSAQATLDDLHQESESRTQKGKKIPQSLIDDIAEAEERVVKLQKDLDTNQKESEAVKARYDAEKNRFRELKGLTQTPPPSPTETPATK